MPIHWTYEAIGTNQEDLEQGDILVPTPELRSLLGQFHSYFSDDKYNAFLVATQSCDLVRRGGTPKATHISLAAVRPCSGVLPRLIAHVQSPTESNVLPKSARGGFRELLRRTLNQNEQALGLFFLHEEADSGIGEHSIAFLRTTFALKSEHYSKLIAARKGRLDPEFRAKLGWLLGNLYGRPATPDWSDKSDGKRAMDQVISAFVDDLGNVCGVAWIEDEVIAAAKAAGANIKELSPKEFEKYRPVPRPKRAISLVLSKLEELAPTLGLTPDIKSKLEQRLTNDRTFADLFKSLPSASDK
mgnify:CR=1 FL=1